MLIWGKVPDDTRAIAVEKAFLYPFTAVFDRRCG